MSPDMPAPRPGESFHCSACDRDSVAKPQKVMDGWRCTGEIMICAFCKTPVVPPSGTAESRPTATENVGASALNRLADLLDAKPVAAPQFADTAVGHFCKDCRHFLRHPFFSRCLLHDKTVEPMDDCGDFTPRPPESANGGSQRRQTPESRQPPGES